MIGLGSNRLTVCRRGGMRVTQAGRGGMEWLAGGRMPSWATPYSAQATAALKAQFPTQWPTIRDYGFAHPEIVGYMNAYAPEDAKIAYSLVEGIGTRWLYNSGSSYFRTGIQGLITAYVRFRFYTSSSWVGIFGCWSTNNWFGQHNGYIAQGDTSATMMSISALSDHTVKAEFRQSDKIISCDGQSNTRSTGDRFLNMEYWVGKVSNHSNISKNDIAFCKIEQGGQLVRNYIPLKRNGQMELLDLVSGNLATRVGTFTELIESPS